MLKLTDRAYLAGIIDGEGSIGIDMHGGYRTPSVRISITNTNMDVLAQIKSLWGGSLTARRKRKLSWKPVADLIWGGSLATNKILGAVQPYLIAKQEQCQVALQFNKTVDSAQTRGVPLKVKAHRQELRQQMLELNKRGT